MKTEKLLDMSIVANRLNVSPATVYRLVHAGLLRVIRTGVSKGYKVRASDLATYLFNRDNDLL